MKFRQFIHYKGIGGAQQHEDRVKTANVKRDPMPQSTVKLTHGKKGIFPKHSKLSGKRG